MNKSLQIEPWHVPGSSKVVSPEFAWLSKRLYSQASLRVTYFERRNLPTQSPPLSTTDNCYHKLESYKRWFTINVFPKCWLLLPAGFHRNWIEANTSPHIHDFFWDPTGSLWKQTTHWHNALPQRLHCLTKLDWSCTHHGNRRRKHSVPPNNTQSILEQKKPFKHLNKNLQAEIRLASVAYVWFRISRTCTVLQASFQ